MCPGCPDTPVRDVLILYTTGSPLQSQLENQSYDFLIYLLDFLLGSFQKT